MRKKKLMIFATVMTLSLSMPVGCNIKQETNGTTTEQQTTTKTPTTTEAPTTIHEHNYTESITKEATCTEVGEKTFSCECGNTYTEPIEAIGHNYEVVADSAINATCEADGKEADTKCSACADVVSGAVIPATGHQYGDYIYNNDATTENNGTETTVCSVCSGTDTRTAENTKLPNLYGMIFEDVDWRGHFSMENQDVYYEPSFDARVIGSLTINDTVDIIAWAYNGDAIYNYPPYDKTEAPTELSWCRVDYNGQIGYIPDKWTWRTPRDMSITLNPLAANYPATDGGGSDLFYPAEDGNWYYIYGAASTSLRVSLNPYCSYVEIYDGYERNVIASITDTSIKFEPTGNAYGTNLGPNVYSYYIYEIYYNGEIAYIDSLNATWE